MDDIFYIGIAFIFFFFTWGLLKMCELLGENKVGDKS